MLENFHKYHKPTDTCVPATKELLEQYSTKLPSCLLDIWKSSGLGKYSNGLIELIDPSEFEANLWTWLGREVPNYVPFALTSFGELLYYRKLTEEDEDVCMIDIQYRKIETLVWSMEAFFDDFLCSENERKEWLREELFMEAYQKQGILRKNEVYTFVPILAFGGAAEIEFVQKGNAQVYLDLVFQMTS